MQGVGFLLLAGGQSRRMGGGDKNQLNLGGKSVLHHILDRVDRAGARFHTGMLVSSWGTF